MSDKFKIYIIYSSLGLGEIEELLKSHASSGFQIGPLRKDFTRDNESKLYVETNRRFILMSELVYNSLLSDGYGNSENKKFYITEYEIRSENKAPKDSVMQFHYPYTEDNKLSILSKMKFIDETGFISSNDYHVHDGVVEFSANVPEYTRIAIKISIDEKNCRVSWCKKFAYRKIRCYFN